MKQSIHWNRKQRLEGKTRVFSEVTSACGRYTISDVLDRPTNVAVEDWDAYTLNIAGRDVAQPFIGIDEAKQHAQKESETR